MRILMGLGVLACASVLSGCSGHGGSGLPDQVSGKAQKGPMTPGALVHLYELDDSLVRTGRSFSTATAGPSADFTLPVDLDSPFVEMEATGHYYNEVTGRDSEAPFILRGIAKVGGSAPVNLNLATTICASRIRKLVAAGSSWKDAREAAETELCAVMGIAGGIEGGFAQADVTGRAERDAALLAISCVFQGGLTAEQLQGFVDGLEDDFTDNGVLDPGRVDVLARQAEGLSLAAIRSRMRTLHGQVPAFQKYAKRLVRLRVIARDGVHRVSPLRPSFSLTFNQELDPASVPSSIGVWSGGRRYEAAVRYDDPSRTITIGSDALPTDAGFTTSLAGLRSCSGHPIRDADAELAGRTLPIDLDAGLTTCLTFNDGTAVDSSGNGNDGQFLGTTSVPDMFGNADAARGFATGHSDRVAIPRTISFTQTHWSFSLWFQVGRTPKSMRHSAVLLSNEHPHYSWVYDDDLPFYIHVDANAWKTLSGKYGRRWTSLQRARSAIWYHAAGVRDGHDYTVFVDGNVVQTIDMGDDFNRFRVSHPASDRLILGHEEIPGGDPSMKLDFDGVIDEVRLYDRSLNEGEVHALGEIYTVPSFAD